MGGQRPTLRGCDVADSARTAAAQRAGGGQRRLALRDGRLLVGAQPLESFVRVIQEERARVR